MHQLKDRGVSGFKPVASASAKESIHMSDIRPPAALAEISSLPPIRPSSNWDDGEVLNKKRSPGGCLMRDSFRGLAWE